MNSAPLQLPADGFGTQLQEFAIYSILPRKFLVCALLYDPSLIDHHDLIGSAHCGKTMGDGDERFPLCQLTDGLKQRMLVFQVRAGCGFVQNDNGRVF